MRTRIDSLALCSLALAAVAALPCAAAEGTDGVTERNIARLERRVATLRESYTLARADADEARRQLRELRVRLEALGGVAVGDREEKLIDTASQLESTRNELDTLRQSSLRLSAAVAAYLRNSMDGDSAERQAIDTAMLELEVALGLRRAKQDEFGGTVDEAQVLSIDSESGLIVINAGSSAKVEVGLPMEISRGDQAIAMAIVTDVRKRVAGLLVQKHLNPALSVGVGDRVTVKSND